MFSFSCAFLARHLARFALFLSVMISLFALEAKAEQRFALIIVNQNYPAEIGILDNTFKDGAVIKKALEDARFKVVLVKDADGNTITNQVRAFVEKLRKARERDGVAPGKGPVGFFYYSGHGASDPSSDDNYLIPVKTPITDLETLRKSAVKFDLVLRELESVGTIHNFVVFDACRKALLLEKAKIATKGLKPIPKKFNQEGLGGGALIMYAADQNDVADDDGFFAKSMAAEIEADPGEPAYFALRATRGAVARSRSEARKATVKSVGFVVDNRPDFAGLQEEFYFKSAKAFEPIPPDPNPDQSKDQAQDPQKIDPLTLDVEKSWEHVRLYFISSSSYYKSPDLKGNPIGELPAGTELISKVEFGRSHGSYWYKFKNLFGQDVYAVADGIETIEGG